MAERAWRWRAGDAIRAAPLAKAPVVGLTDVDMFIPDVSWRYAFSKREPPRFAVVSTARMDRGCMGIVRASSGIQMARLRKMVGKNIGVLSINYS